MRQLNLISDGGVEHNREIRGDNDGRDGSDRICFWNGRCSGTGSVTKTLKEKGILDEDYKDE